LELFWVCAMAQPGGPRFLTAEGDFKHRSLLVEFVMDTVTLGCVFLPIITQLLHIHLPPPPSGGPGSPHYRRYTITLKQTTFGRTPLDG